MVKIEAIRLFFDAFRRDVLSLGLRPNRSGLPAVKDFGCPNRLAVGEDDAHPPSRRSRT
jgi:hypothetical protein